MMYGCLLGSSFDGEEAAAARLEPSNAGRAGPRPADTAGARRPSSPYRAPSARTRGSSGRRDPGERRRDPHLAGPSVRSWGYRLPAERALRQSTDSQGVPMAFTPESGDALVVVDMQRD